MARGKLIVSLIAFASLIVFLFAPFPGGSLWQRLKESPEEHQARLQYQNKFNEYFENFKKFSHGRFTSAAEFKVTEEKTGWKSVSVGNIKARLQDSSQIIWSEKLKLTLPEGTDSNLGTAQGECQRLEPSGVWTLPTVAEFALARRDGGHKILKDFEGPWLATFVEKKTKTYRPLAFKISEGPLVEQPNPAVRIGIRCVARTDKAPANGYFNEDIEPEELMELVRATRLQ